MTAAAGTTTFAAPAGERRSARPTWMLWTALALLAVFVAFAVHVAVDPKHPFTQPLDDAWRRLVGSGPGGLEGSVPSLFFQNLGELAGAVLMIIVIPAVLFIVGRWRSALFFLANDAIASIAIAQIAKNLVNRPRPAADGANGLFGPLFDVDHGSFPSGHAVTVGALVIGVAALIPAGRRLIWWIVSAVLVVGIVWQRTLINAHWLSDTLFGVLAGVLASILVWWAFYPLLQRDYGRRLFNRK
jgi:membrane-associated phospholipid phosphatase